MTNKMEKTVSAFIRKYKLTEISCDTLKNAATKMGYTIIEFNAILNEGDVKTVIQNLGLNEKVLQSRGFTYASSDYRLIFINEDLSDDEKTLVLSHELGHIVCGHMQSESIIGKDVKEEHEANEFSHYLLLPGTFVKIKRAMSRHRRTVVITVIALCLIFGSLTAYIISRNNHDYAENYYVTATGGRYHRKECIFVKYKTNIKKLTTDQYKKGTYSPCEMCLPDEN